MARVTKKTVRRDAEGRIEGVDEETIDVQTPDEQRDVEIRSQVAEAIAAWEERANKALTKSLADVAAKALSVQGIAANTDALVAKATAEASARALAIVERTATATFKQMMLEHMNSTMGDYLDRIRAEANKAVKAFKRQEDEDPDELEEDAVEFRPAEVEQAEREQEEEERVERRARVARLIRANTENLGEVMEALKSRLRERGIILDYEGIYDELAEQAHELEKTFAGHSAGHPLVLDDQRRIPGRFPGSDEFQGREWDETGDEAREYDRDKLPRHGKHPGWPRHPEGHPDAIDEPGAQSDIVPGVRKSRSRKGSIPFGPSRWRRER